MKLTSSSSGSITCTDDHFIPNEEAGATIFTMKCLWHRCSNETPEPLPHGKDKKFCSRACCSKFHVSKRRRDIKAMAVALKGGKCQKCGYSKSISALHFHHKHNKSFAISKGGQTRGWERVKQELEKCELLCANCHAELHELEDHSPVG